MATDDLVGRQQAINRQILDRVSSDPTFKQQLIDSPEQALQALGVADEITQIQSMIDANDAAEVVGHGCGTRFQGCGYWSSRWYCTGYGWKFGPWAQTQ